MGRWRRKYSKDVTVVNFLRRVSVYKSATELCILGNESNGREPCAADMRNGHVYSRWNAVYGMCTVLPPVIGEDDHGG